MYQSIHISTYPTWGIGTPETVQVQSSMADTDYYLSIFLYIYPSIYIPLHVSIYPSIYIPLYVSICLSSYLYIYPTWGIGTPETVQRSMADSDAVFTISLNVASISGGSDIYF